MSGNASPLWGIQRLNESVVFAEHDPANEVGSVGPAFLESIQFAANGIGEDIQVKCATVLASGSAGDAELDQISRIMNIQSEGRDTVSAVAAYSENQIFVEAIQPIIGLPRDESVLRDWKQGFENLRPLIEKMRTEIVDRRTLFKIVSERSKAKIRHASRHADGYSEMLEMLDPSQSNPELWARILVEDYGFLQREFFDAVTEIEAHAVETYRPEFGGNSDRAQSAILYSVIIPLRYLVTVRLFLEKLSEKIGSPTIWRP